MGFLAIVTIAAILWALRERGLRAQQAITDPTPATTPSSPPVGASWRITWKEGRETKTVDIVAPTESDAIRIAIHVHQMRFDRFLSSEPV